MTENQFDDHFRNRLGDYASQVPEDMWERVRPKKDNGRKGFFFWLLYAILPGFLLVGLAAAYFMVSRPSTPSQPSALLQSPAPSPSPNPAPVSIPAESPIPSTSAHRSASLPPPAPSQSPAPLPPPAPSQSPNPSPVSAPARPPIPSSSKSTAVRVTPGQSFRQSSDIAASTYDQSTTNRHPSSPARVSTDARTTHLPIGLPELQPIPRSLGRVTAQIPFQKTVAPVKPAPAKKDSPAKAHDWYLDVFASPDWPFASKETSHQQMLFSYTAGVKLSRAFGQHFSGTVGLQYSELKSKASNSDSSLLPRTRSSSIDIPLLIGYTITKSHFMAAVNTGIILNAKTWGIPYKQHTGFSWYLGLDIAGKINHRISLFAEPYIRYRLSNMVDARYSFTSKVNVAGFSVGLRYNFKNPRKNK